MIRPPSLQRAYDDFFTRDPAFIQPPAEPSATASDDEQKAYQAALEEYEAKIKAARETGRWDDVLVPGFVPTKFVLGQVNRNAWRALLDRAALPSDNPQRIGPGMMVALLFRLAIRNIVGWDVKIVRQPDPKWEGWELAQEDLVTALDEIDPRIVGQIGNGIYQRLKAISDF